MVRLGWNNHVHLFNEMDLEKPAYHSAGNVVVVYHSFNPRNQIGALSFNVTLPVHFRYQLPSSTSQHVQVYIDPPLLYLFCQRSDYDHEGEILRDMSENVGKDNTIETLSTVLKLDRHTGWIRLDPLDMLNLTMVVNIPVGQRSVEGLVSAITLGFTTLTALTVLYFAYKTKKNCTTLQMRFYKVKVA
eukprot:TRINITY_DN5752_c0_g1_i1.p1 TRINITY_DN5752_c0_g1~~TRINITY_DN5752_c0_g1_i1.p1  ORF type:complete len:188 (-),score=19.28 TRINITY_DN5752_c0_g1_i1:91-654(-)